MNKYLNKTYDDDLTEFQRMSMHQPTTFDSTSVTKKVRMKKSNQIKTTREEARFFDDEPSKPKRKRIRRPQQEHDLQRDMARPVQRKDPKYKNAAEIGLEKAKQKRAQPGKDWIEEVVSPPTKKVKMIVAENELPTPNLTKSTKIRDGSSKKPQLKSKKVTNKYNEKVTKPPNQLNKSRPRSKSRNNARPSKSDKKTKSASDENTEKPKKPVTESKKPKPDSKKISKVEEFRRLLAEQKSNTEHVRETGPTSIELQSAPPNIIVPPVQQKSVLDELGFSSSQESNNNESEVDNERQACELCKMAPNINEYCSSCSSASETEKEPETKIVRMEIQDEQPSEIIEIVDDEDDVVPSCPTPLSFGDSDDENDDADDDDDVIFICSSNIPLYQDPSTGQSFCYGQDLDDF